MIPNLINFLATILGVVVSMLTIIGILIKFSDKLLRGSFKKLSENLKVKDLDPRSDLFLISKIPDVMSDIDNLKGSHKMEDERIDETLKLLNSMSRDLNQIKLDRFKDTLRSRLEYVITNKGSVDDTYWHYIADDYNHYTNDLKMNTYVTSLYKEAERLYIDKNVKDKEFIQ